MTQKDFVITLRGNNGIFRTENKLTLFAKHTTQKNLKEQLQAVRKEVVKMLKSGDVSIDLTEMVNYNYYEKVRLIVRRWDFQVEYRPITTIQDFSDITTYTFTSTTEQLKYVIKNIHSLFDEVVGEVPESVSFYAQSL